MVMVSIQTYPPLIEFGLMKKTQNYNNSYVHVEDKFEKLEYILLLGFLMSSEQVNK